MKYTCNKCGLEHEGWPTLTYNAPVGYHNLTDEEKDTIAEIGSDHCIITYENQTDRFIRCTLIQKVNEQCQNLEYGIWVSLSEKSYNDYADNFNNGNHVTAYFGYLSNNIPGYENTLNIYTNVYTKMGNDRPEIVPHDDFDHPFVKDYYNGISKVEAEQRVKDVFNKKD